MEDPKVELSKSGNEEERSDDNQDPPKKMINETRKFAWKHENTKAWEKVKHHPDSGVKMSETNITHEDNNPCVKEHNLSMQCLFDKAYQRDLCQVNFENYRLCRKFWHGVVVERKRNGIRPHLPLGEEREHIREAHFSSRGGPS